MPFHFISNAVGVKQYSVVEYPNPNHRQYMEDSTNFNK